MECLDVQTVRRSILLGASAALRIAIATRHMHACRRTQLASLIDFSDIGGALGPTRRSMAISARSRIHLNS